MTKQRLTYIDTLRVLATILVIFIHVSSLFISAHGAAPGEATYRFAYCFSLCAVAIFVMISGMLLLSKPQTVTYSRVLTHYLPRILWALLIFALPMCLIEQIMTHPTTGTASLLSSALINFLTGHSWTHMWYLYMLPGLYLITPLLHTFNLHTTRKEHTQLAIALGTLGIVLPNISMLTGVHMEDYMLLPSFVATFYVGYYLYTYCPDNTKTIVASGICLILYTAYCAFATRSMHPIVGPEFGLSIAAVAAMFCIIRRWPLCTGLCQWLSPHCFCIYIVHPVFLNIFFKILHIETYATGSAAVNMILVAGATFLLSLLTSYLLRLVPFLRNRVL